MSAPWLVTGAFGCIGAWVVKLLAERGERVVAFDLGEDPRRVRDVLAEEHFAALRLVRGDLTDRRAVRDAIATSGARRVIHLAGLQVPFCKADPAVGALVNVAGTLHVLEAARELELERVVYASSAAVYGPFPPGVVPDETAPCEPRTHYGAFKRANEANARVHFADHGVSSVGLRPLTVYGVGRDQGLTSGPTSALKAALLGRPFPIGFTGATDFVQVRDCAEIFIACAERAPAGAHVWNLAGDSVDLCRFIELADAALPPERRGLITCAGEPLPLPAALDGRALRAAVPGLPRTPLEGGIAATLRAFAELHAAGRLDTRDLDA